MRWREWVRFQTFEKNDPSYSASLIVSSLCRQFIMQSYAKWPWTAQNNALWWCTIQNDVCRSKWSLLTMCCAFWRCNVQNKASDNVLCKTRPSHDVPCKTRPPDDVPRKTARPSGALLCLLTMHCANQGFWRCTGQNKAFSRCAVQIKASWRCAVQNETFRRCVVPFDDAMCKTRLLTMYCAKQGLFTMCRAKQGLLTTRRAKRDLLAMYCAFWRCTVQNKASDDTLCKTRPSHDVPCKTRPSDDACTVQLPSNNALSLTIDASLVQSNGPRSCTAHKKKLPLRCTEQSN